MRVELLNGKDIEDRIKMVAASGRLSRYPGSVFDVLDKCQVYEKNTNIIRNIIDMGHKSIIEHDYLVFALSDVTPIIEQILIGSRLASFTVKSRREVDFSNVGYYVPDFSYLSNGEEITNIYKEHMNYLFSSYSQLLECGVGKEDARFVLPYCYNDNFIMGTDARCLERIIDYCLNSKASKIKEVHELGERLLEICKTSVPYLDKQLSKLKPHDEDAYAYLDDLLMGSDNLDYDVIDKPKLIGYTENPDDKILISIIMNRYQVSETRASDILKELRIYDPYIDSTLMNTLYYSKEQRELEQVNFQIRMPFSLASLTHVTRHRMHSLLIPDFTPMWDLDKYLVPSSVRSINFELYKEVYKENIRVYNLLKEKGVKEEDLVYFYLSGNTCNVLTTMNARTLMWISRMRCCNKAQWEIREVFNDIVNQVREVAPLLGRWLGPTCEVEHKCYEGKECCGKIKTLGGKNEG